MKTCRDSLDGELLERYGRTGDEEAFGELVRRHLDFVHASARRQVGSEHAADVAQAVFLVLARKAGSMRPDTALAAWLFRTTRFVAARVRRGEARRHRRELAAGPMLHPTSTPAGSASPTLALDVDRHLDDALACLPEGDRRFVLARFYERSDFAAVGARFGVSAEAARKRVDRALERLRGFLARRGLPLTAATLVGLLAEGSTEAAPAGLSTAIARLASLPPAPPAAPVSAPVEELVSGATSDWFWLEARRVAALAATVGVLSGTLAWAVLGPSRSAVAPPLGSRPASDSVPAPAALVADSAKADPRESVRRFRLDFRDAETDRVLADVRVVLQIWDDRRLVRTETARSGADGVCTLPVREPEPALLRFWVSAPGHVPVFMDFHRYELDRPDFEYRCRLLPGTTLRGRVVDASGRPIAGASVRFQEPGLDLGQRENIGFHPDLTGVESDAEGIFVSDQMPSAWSGSPMEISLRHPDFARAEYSVADARAWATNHHVVLGAGFPFRGRVHDADGAPIAAARVRRNANEGWAEESVATDGEGRFEFPHLPPGPFPFVATATGYERHEGYVEAGPDLREAAIRLVPAEASSPAPEARPPRWVNLKARVLAADGGHAIPRFRVLLREDGGRVDRFLGEGRDGAFDWRVDARFFADFSLQIEAEGCLPVSSDTRDVGAPEDVFLFRLPPGTDVEGMVLQPDGQPATGARVALAGADRGFTLVSPGYLENPGGGGRFLTTGGDGRFRLRRAYGDERIQIAHETGSAFRDLAGLTGEPIRLEPWSTVEGTIRVGDRPFRNAQVNLGRAPESGSARRAHFDLGYTTRADAEGRFRLTHVPTGTHVLMALVPRGFLSNRVEVAAGTTVVVELRKE